MMLAEAVYAQAAALAGEMDAKQEALLGLLCEMQVNALAARLKKGVLPEDVQGDFVPAAALLALAEFEMLGETGGISEFKAGDLTVRKEGAAHQQRADGLRRQAMGLMEPYLLNRVAFLGV